MTVAEPAARRSSRPVAGAGRLAALLGADPAVFIPFVRAYSTIVRRRSRMRLTRGISPKAMSGVSPFLVACLFAGLLGLGVAAATAWMSPSLMGAALSLTFGSLLVVFSVLFDYLDVLASPDEYRVIAAHPHDAWSVLLAKIVVVGRALATLAACYFTPSLVAIGFIRHSVTAVAAYALGAALVTAAASLASMLVGVGILARWGRVALLRFLPAIQAFFLLGYITLSMGRRLIIATGFGSARVLPAWVTLAPPVWFAAPLEWVTGTATPATLLRAVLAAGALAAMVAIAVRWGRGGFGEALLAYGSAGPSPSSHAKRAVARRHRQARRPWVRDPETRAFLSMARIHARTDLAFRSQMVVSVIMPAMIFLSPAFSGGPRRLHAIPEVALLLASGAVGMAIVSLTGASATSTRPEALWPVLIAPVERVRYAMAPSRMFRWFLVAPLVAVAGGWYLATAVGVPIVERFARVAGVAIYLDLLVTLQRGLAPDFPFSVRPSRDRRMPWSHVLGMLAGFAIGGGGGFGLFFMWLIPGWGAWAAIGSLLVTRFLIAKWTRWRVRRVALALEAI